MAWRQIRVFRKPHKSRKRENEFCAFLVKSWDAELVPTAFVIDPTFTRLPVGSQQLVRWLEADRLLPAHRREQCIERLRDLPEQIVITLRSHRISFDFVVERGQERYYWEFHEQQHLKLADDRPQAVYAADGSMFRVPRYLQRLLRDVWRVKYFPNLTIVWHDWFAENRDSYVPVICRGFQEYHRPGMFSFRAFCTA
jgi:hypothetical protein